MSREHRAGLLIDFIGHTPEDWVCDLLMLLAAAMLLWASFAPKHVAQIPSPVRSSPMLHRAPPSENVIPAPAPSL